VTPILAVFMLLVAVSAQVDCPNDPYADGQLDSTACKCKPYYKWNDLSCGIDCPNIPNADP